MNEIKRMQQLAGIITEVKVNNPTVKKSMSYNDAVELDKMGSELFNYINHNYNPEPRILRVNKTTAKKMISISKKNKDNRIIELLEKYLKYKNQFKKEIDEVKVNKPFPIKFEDTIEGKTYNFEIKPEFGEGGELEVILHDDAMEGPFIIVKHIGDEMEDSFELYPEDVISIRRA